MPFTREYAGVRRELEINQPGTLYLWPKRDGESVIVQTAVASIGAATLTTIGSPAAYSRINVALLAESELAEDRPLEVTWTMADGFRGKSVCVYDVVRSPCGPLVSLNQLQEARPDILRILTRIGAMLSPPPATALTAEAVAGIYSARARVELQDRLRIAALGLEVARPALHLDRDRLPRVETSLALAKVYEAIAKDPTAGTDDDSAQARAWRADYERGWEQLGPLLVDTDQDGDGDEHQKPSADVIYTKRK